MKNCYPFIGKWVTTQHLHSIQSASESLNLIQVQKKWCQSHILWLFSLPHVALRWKTSEENLSWSYAEISGSPLVIWSPNFQCLLFKRNKTQWEIHPEKVIAINSKRKFIPYVKFNLNQLRGIGNLMKLIHWGPRLIQNSNDSVIAKSIFKQ